MSLRGFVKINENTIMFDNGATTSFYGRGDTNINGKSVSVKEFMDYLFSEEYLKGIILNSEEHKLAVENFIKERVDKLVKNG